MRGGDNNTGCVCLVAVHTVCLMSEHFGGWLVVHCYHVIAGSFQPVYIELWSRQLPHPKCNVMALATHNPSTLTRILIPN